MGNRKSNGRRATGCFVAGSDMYLLLGCVKKRALAPRVPEGWNSAYEVPFGMNVEAPLVRRVCGLKMLDEPFSLALSGTKPFFWAF